MHEGRGTERGASSVEYVGTAVAIAALVAVLGGVLSGSGGELARGVVDRVRSAVLGEPSGGAARTGRSRARGEEVGSGSWRDAEERRWSSGTEPPRVSRNDLRFEPILPGWSLWSGSAERRGTVAGAVWDAQVSACALCVDAGWRDSWRVGASGSGGPSKGGASVASGAGVEAEVQTATALLSTEVLAHVGRTWRAGGFDLRGRAQGIVGADADLRLTGRVTPTGGAEVEARAGAMAGAAARGEAKAGLTLLGIALTSTARGEAWAGAGARGRIGATIENGSFSWNVGAGAALGFGGAGEWSGTVDVSALPERHREAALRTVRLALGGVIPGLAGTAPLLPTNQRRPEG